MITVPIKLLYADSIPPFRKHNDDAGMDFYLHRRAEVDEEKKKQDPNHEPTVLSAMQERLYTGVAMAIPRGHVGLLFMRSSVCDSPQRFENAVGVIDSTHRGEVYAVVSPAIAHAAMTTSIGVLLQTIVDSVNPQIGTTTYNYLQQVAEMLNTSHNEHVDEIKASEYKVGERFCQMVIFPIPQVDTHVLGEGEELPKTERGEGGYGSTGRT
jgi:dUTPase